MPARKIKAPILAWWGIIPTAGYVVVQTLYGWGEARFRATAPQFAISYFIGGLIAGPLISLIVAWVAYRVSGRSQRVATIVFTLVIALLCLSVRNMARSRALLSSSQRQIAPSPNTSAIHAFPSAGLMLRSPPAWQEAIPDRGSVVAEWISPESRPGTVRALIMVELKRPASTDSHEIASQLAQSWGGKVIDKPDVLDGERAWKIQAPVSKSELQPLEAVIAIHQGRLYMIEGGGMPGYSCHEQVEFIRSSWKWTSIDSAAKHLEFRAKPLVVFSGKVSINFPAAMNTFDNGHPDRSLGLSLRDTKRDTDAFTAFVQFGEHSTEDTLAATEARLSRGIQDRFKLSQAFIWHTVGGSATRVITQPVRGPAQDGANWIMWAVIWLDDNRFVLINFTIYADDLAERAAYAKAAEDMAESISLTAGNKPRNTAG